MKKALIVIEIIGGLIIMLGSLFISASIVSFIPKNDATFILAYLLLIPFFWGIGFFLIALGMRNLSNLKKK